MILTLEIQALKLGLGAKKSGAELTLADTAKPQCLCPFSYYVSDVSAFEEHHKVKLADMRFKNVVVGVTCMSAPSMGNAIKLEGELQLGINPKDK